MTPAARRAYLREHLWCRPCRRYGRVARSSDVLHEDDPQRREPVCATCYEVATGERRTKPCGCGG